MARKKSTGIVDESGSDIEQFGTIFDQLGVKEPTQAAPDPAPAAQAPDVAALLAKIDTLAGTVNALASRPAPQPQYITPTPTPSAPQWDWADPGIEPEKFAATLAGYTNYVIEQREAVKQAEQERINAQRQKTQGLWDDFSSQYKDYTENQGRVGYAYQAVTGRLAQRGIDVDQYASYNKADLFKAVAAEYDSVFGKPGQPAQDDDADDSNRTAGIFGGIEAGGQPSKGKEKPGDMIADLKDIQRASGFF